MNNNFKEQYWMEKYKKEQKKRERILTVIVVALFIGAFMICNKYTKDSINNCLKNHSSEECFARV